MSSLSCLNASFIDNNNPSCSEQHHGVDLETASECFNVISKVEHPSIIDTVSVGDFSITDLLIWFGFHFFIFFFYFCTINKCFVYKQF